MSNKILDALVTAQSMCPEILGKLYSAYFNIAYIPGSVTRTDIEDCIRHTDQLLASLKVARTALLNAQPEKEAAQ